MTDSVVINRAPKLPGICNTHHIGAIDSSDVQHGESAVFQSTGGLAANSHPTLAGSYEEDHGEP